MKVTLSNEEVEAIVEAHLSKTYANIRNVKLEATMQTTGLYTQERQEPVANGVSFEMDGLHSLGE